VYLQIKPIITILITLTILFTSCSKDKKEIIENKNITAKSDDVVTIKGINAKAYSWTQISGIDVILIDPNTATPSFIAPEVKEKKILEFELQALITSLGSNDIIRKDIATVTINPNEEKTPSSETNTTTQSTISLKSLKLTIDKNSLNIETNTTLKVLATYSDNTTKDVTNNTKWILSDTDAVEIQKNTIRTKKETNIIIQASYQSITSNPQAIEIYKEINGHRLPPEPDPTINNSTLLGVDSNNNDVRDDVERWIYEEYKEKHPIHMDIAMQAGKAYKQVLETPERALEIHDEVNRATYCQLYYRLNAKYFNEPILIQKNAVNRYFRLKIYYNTEERIDTYLQYDKLLSGGVYTLPPFRERKAMCDFNTSKYEE
jgi:hypothetical protein